MEIQCIHLSLVIVNMHDSLQFSKQQQWKSVWESKASLTPYVAWKLLIDKSVLCQVQKYTVIEEKKTKPKLGATCKHVWRFHSIAMFKTNIWKSSLSRFIAEWNIWTKNISRNCAPEECSRRFIQYSLFSPIWQWINLLNDEVIPIKSRRLESCLKNLLWMMQQCIPTYSLTIHEQLMLSQSRCHLLCTCPTNLDWNFFGLNKLDWNIILEYKRRCKANRSFSSTCRWWPTKMWKLHCAKWPWYFGYILQRFWQAMSLLCHFLFMLGIFLVLD